MDAIAAFVGHLATAECAGHVVNPYAGETDGAAERRANLSRYLDLMARRETAVLLVGEAPGHRGCGRTGIPFTSEAILAGHPFFGVANGFVYPATCTPQREATATTVWQVLDELGLRPLLWNAFPFHPHQPGNRAGNRPPTAAELRAGRPLVVALLAAFPIQHVVAVGGKAARALGQWGIAAQPVRHPSHGGSTRFRAGMQQWLAAYSQAVA